MRSRAPLHVLASLLLLALLTSPLDAQEHRLGLVGGLTLGNFGGLDSGDTDSSPGFDVGAFLSWSLGDTWAIRSGVFYVQKGAKASGETSSAEFDFDYVEIPLLIEARLPTTGTAGIYVFGGPAVAFQVGCAVEFADSGTTSELDCDDEFFEGTVDPKAMDVGLMIGGGFDYPVGSTLDLVLEASYTLGMTSFDDSQFRFNLKNRALQLNAGARVRVGG